MGQFRIRLYGSFGAGVGIGGSLGSYQIEDRQSQMSYIYDFISLDGSLSPLKLTVGAVSDWSNFEWFCALEEFGGEVFVWSVATGVNTPSMTVRGHTVYPGMSWIGGGATGCLVKTTGWQASTPGVGGSLIRLVRRAGKPTFRLGELPVGWGDRFDAKVSIWRPLYPQFYLFVKPGAAALWGDLTLNMGNTRQLSTDVNPVWEWKWYPNAGKPPAALLPSFEGLWYYQLQGDDQTAILSFAKAGYFGTKTLGGEFCRLSRFRNSMNPGSAVGSTEENAKKAGALAYQNGTQTNARINGYDVVYLLTECAQVGA